MPQHGVGQHQYSFEPFAPSAWQCVSRQYQSTFIGLPPKEIKVFLTKAPFFPGCSLYLLGWEYHPVKMWPTHTYTLTPYHLSLLYWYLFVKCCFEKNKKKHMPHIAICPQRGDCVTQAGLRWDKQHEKVPLCAKGSTWQHFQILPTCLSN